MSQPLTHQITDLLLHKLAHKDSFRRFTGLINNQFPFGMTIGINVSSYTLFAATLDRLVALLLWKYFSHESYEQRIIRQFLKPGMTAYDLGANIGYYSLFLSRTVGASGKVYAFEPEKLNVFLLQKALKINLISNVEIVHKAVSNVTGDSTLYLSREHMGNHTLFAIGDNRVPMPVKTVALAQFCKLNQPPHFIKMDIEGSEYHAIEGLKPIVTSLPNLVIVSEFAPDTLKANKVSPMLFLETMRLYGFSCRLIDEKKQSLHRMSHAALLQLATKEKFVNLLFHK